MVTQNQTNHPVVIEIVYQSPIASVWTAITDLQEMKKWYFDLSEFKPEVGVEFQFIAGESEDNQYLHMCKVTKVVPGRKISYSWKFEGYDGISYVTFELNPEGKNTRLKLTHTGLETFPKSNPDFKKENFEEGWSQITGTSLKDYLEKSRA